MAASDVQTYSNSRNSGEVLKGIAAGAGSGAGVGSVAGPWGAVAGAVIGGVIGGVSGGVADDTAQKAEIEESRAAERAAIGAKNDEKAMLRAQNALNRRSAQEGGIAAQAAPSSAFSRASMGSTSVTPYDTWRSATY